MRTSARTLLLTSALLLGLVACGGDSSDEADPVPGTDLTVKSTSTTAEPTTTTTEPSTTSTQTVDDVEEAVRAAHTRVMTELFARDERVDGPEAMLPLAEELTTGPLLARIKENLETQVETGERIAGPGFDSNIVSVEVNGDRADVLDCSLDQSELFDASGDLVGGPATAHKYRTGYLVLVDGNWLMEDIAAGGDERCDPNDLP